MSDPSERPDPDQLLRRLQQAEARAQRGKLKVFFGFAPGVGKTYRMLQVARELASKQKLDVVIGVVEDHKRIETANMVSGLELLPRRTVEYRGSKLEEFDLDAALARKPALLLVDELAHTNAVGSRHPKRWQDVNELLDAGIDVFTTVNVQHVESLNDVVAQITRVQVRETVPDSAIDAAEAIELVDIAPEELLERLKDGKVYLPEQAKRAAQHFFQRGNLLALRELALRRTAQHVDEDVREYREEHAVVVPWPAGERLLVCIGPAPSSGRLLRAAARMAASLRCPWVAAYVESNVRPMSEVDRTRLEAHLRTAESLGATVTRLSGTSISGALLEYARKYNVTRLIIGKPTHSRVWDRLRGSLLDEVVRGSGDIDVLAINGSRTDEEQPLRKVAARDRPAPASHYVAATLIVAASLGLALLLRSLMDLPDLEMLFLLAVMVTAVWFGRGPSLLAAGLGVASYDFFFVQPLYTFSVHDRRYFLTFGMIFAVGWAMSELAQRLRRQQREAQSREERTAVLYALTRELASVEAPATIATIAARHAANIFAAQANILTVADGALQSIAVAPEGAPLDAKDFEVAIWSHEHKRSAGLGTDTLPGAKALCTPLCAGASQLGVLVLAPQDQKALRTDQREFLDVLGRQVAVALERARLSEEAKQSALRAKTEEMRSSLLSAVSHDLRTPLATITGAATSLRDDEKLATETRGELVDSIVDQAERLERLVANLLDMTRLESGAIALRRDWVPLEEMVGSALTRLETRLGVRELKVSIPPEVPLVLVDPVLFEQVFVNLLENAEKYTPPGSPIEISARNASDCVEVSFRDHGPGLPLGSELKVFEKFFRGAHIGVAGVGLGLPICKGILEAHGGAIRAETHPAGGAAFYISIPHCGSPPDVPSPTSDS